MRKNIYYVTIAFISTFATDVIADGTCSPPLTPHTVVGSIATTNVGQSVQVGTIYIKLFSEGDDPESAVPVFEEDGGIVGRIDSINTDVYPITATLNHHIVTTNGGTIDTNGDQAMMTPLSDCYFQVSEIISNLQGTKEFKKVSGEVFAEGTVSFCEGANGNNFELSGTVCFQP